MNALKLTVLVTAITGIAACGSVATQSDEAPRGQETASAAQQQTADERAEALFETIFEDEVSRSPMFQTYLGRKTDYGKWDPLTEAFYEETLAANKRHLAELRTIDPEQLSEGNRLSYELMEVELSNKIADHRWRYHNYPVNQMFGYDSEAPALLINQHQIETVEDAEAYISRLEGFTKLFGELEVWLEKQAGLGILPPKFVYPLVIDSSENVLVGAPFDSAGQASASPVADSALLADFKTKVGALDIDEDKKNQLIEEAKAALLQHVQPAYRGLIAKLESLESRADDRAGAWKLPDGEAYYNTMLARTTTTDMTADEIHQLGLKEVERIHTEMRDIMQAVGFSGTLPEFFEKLESDPEFYYPPTDEGKAAYLSETHELIDTMKSRLDELFITKPQADLVVKQVEPFREKAAGEAFYMQPAADGSRPGVYYVNLYDMKGMPKYEMEALAYHEGVPGHHMQIAISQEIEDIPEFRKYINYTAYIEGWGLYSELLPKEMGLYEDPYSDFGRLSMELLRATRLVVDTGLHAKQWSREKAIQYLKDNMPISELAATKAIDRYIVMPSQATAYKIGMLKIIELREKARAALGDEFDVRQYHDLVLKNGALPLNVLERRVDRWIEKSKAA